MRGSEACNDRGRWRIGGCASAVDINEDRGKLGSCCEGRQAAACGSASKPLTEIEAELGRVKRELAEVKMERDLLKKFATYFARERPCCLTLNWLRVLRGHRICL